MLLGSLFDGIGGFPLAAQRHEITPVWASEIEKFPIEVTKKHFPDMKHLGDITQINGAEIEPVDIITFGSPCQDLSIAGKREGLEGARSGLFMDAVRIIRQMRTATDGRFPRFAVWENVPGAFSSNKGEDFRAVLEEIAEAEIPMPPSGKWATAGMVRTERIDIAWRTLDAQYWGVPQRRKRIFLVADFIGQCAGEILFKPSRLSWNSAESREARQEAVGNVGDGIAKPIGIDVYNFAESRDIAVTLTANSGSSPTHAGPAVMVSRIDSSPEGISGAVSSKWAKGTGGPAGDECYNLVVLADQGGSQMSVLNNLSPTLRAQEHGHQPIVVEPRSQDGVCRVHDDGIVPTLNTAGGGQRQPCVMAFITGNTGSIGCADGISPTLKSDAGGNTVPGVLTPSYAVRRLTPTECLRLQGFPDWWLDIEVPLHPKAPSIGKNPKHKDWTEKQRIQKMSDTAKYKAIGNSVAIPCVEFVIRRIKEVC